MMCATSFISVSIYLDIVLANMWFRNGASKK